MSLEKPTDMERFILEIKARPSIWDKNSKEYSDRDLKKKCWSELVQIFMRKEDASEADLNEFGRVLQRRWKSLRDCFVRECRRVSRVKTKNSALRKTQYMYYNHLSFLSPFVKIRSISKNVLESSEEVAGDIKEEMVADVPEPASIGIGKKRRKLNKKFDEDFEEIVNIHKTDIEDQVNESSALESDCDRLFLLSLLNHLKEVPPQNRFSVKMQMMQVIDQARQATSIPIPGLSNNSNFTWQNPSVPCMQFYQSQPAKVAFTPKKNPLFHGKKRRARTTTKTSQRNPIRELRKQKPVELTPLSNNQVAKFPQSATSYASDQSVESDASVFSNVFP